MKTAGLCSGLSVHVSPSSRFRATLLGWGLAVSFLSYLIYLDSFHHFSHDRSWQPQTTPHVFKTAVLTGSPNRFFCFVPIKTPKKKTQKVPSDTSDLIDLIHSSSPASSLAFFSSGAADGGYVSLRFRCP